MAPLPVELQIVYYNPYDAVALRLPRSLQRRRSGWRIPLSVDSAGGVNAVELSGTALTARDIGASVLLSGDFTSTMKSSLNASTPLYNRGGQGSVTGNVGGNVAGSVASVTARVTANTDQLAGQTVTAAAGVTFPTSVASPTNITAGTITAATNLTNAPTNGDFTAAMKTSLNAATPASITGAVGSVTGNVGGNVVGSVGSVTADVGITQAGADKVWASVSRTLTSFGTLTTDTATAVSASGTRTLTSFGTLVADVVTAVWGAASRTLSAFGFTVTTDISTLVNTDLDVQVSSRLASSSYTTPPTTAQNADALLARSIGGGSNGGHTVQDALSRCGTRSRRRAQCSQSTRKTTPQSPGLEISLRAPELIRLSR